MPDIRPLNQSTALEGILKSTLNSGWSFYTSLSRLYQRGSVLVDKARGDFARLEKELNIAVGDGEIAWTTIESLYQILTSKTDNALLDFLTSFAS